MKLNRYGNFDGMDSAAAVETIDVDSIQLNQGNEPNELEGDGAGAVDGTLADPVRESEERGKAGTGANRRGRVYIFSSGRAGVHLDFDGKAKTPLPTAVETNQRRSEPSARKLARFVMIVPAMAPVQTPPLRNPRMPTLAEEPVRRRI